MHLQTITNSSTRKAGNASKASKASKAGKTSKASKASKSVKFSTCEIVDMLPEDSQMMST
jgi:hypothetical protein